jgi:hypothetical protein
LANNFQRRRPVALPGNEPFGFAQAKESARDRVLDDEDRLIRRLLFADGQIIPQFGRRKTHDTSDPVVIVSREVAGISGNLPFTAT